MEIAIAEKTMSSREIAELTGKEHDNVRRDIMKMAISLSLTFEEKDEQSQGGRPYRVFTLGKRETLILVSGYSIEMRARIIDRWQELEAAQASKLPQTYAQALRLAAEQAEQIEAQQLQIEAQKPAVEFVGRYVEATGLKGFRQVAKLLNVKEPAFREFLTRHKIMYHLGGEWVAYSQHIEAGRFEVKAGVSEGTGHAFNASKFTPKGVEWIAGLMAKENVTAALKAE